MQRPGDLEKQVNLFTSFCRSCEKENFINPGQELIAKVLNSREEGIKTSVLVESISSASKLTSAEVHMIITHCIDLDIILSVGFNEELLLGRQYSYDWVQGTSHTSRSRRDHSSNSPQNEPAQPNQHKIESDFSKYFPLPLKPWRTVTSDTNIELLTDLSKSLVLFIYTCPGASKDLIDRR